MLRVRCRIRPSALHNSNGTVIAANDNWRDAQEALIQSNNLAPTDNRESAVFASLSAGNYTAIVHGRNGPTGVALVEVYRVPLARRPGPK